MSKFNRFKSLIAAGVIAVAALVMPVAPVMAEGGDGGTGSGGTANAQSTHDGQVQCPKNSKAGANAWRDTYAQCNMTETQAKDNDLFGTVSSVINVILGVMGVVAVIVIILGGFTYMMSSGDAGKTKQAKDTIMYGIIGLIVALLAFAIVNFVLSNVFGGD